MDNWFTTVTSKIRTFFGWRKTTARSRLGTRGENAATRLLKAKGYVILARNVRYKRLEIDIVARDGINLCFIEVKTSYKIRPREAKQGIAVHRDQKQRILRAAHRYMHQIGHPQVPVRFDFIEVTFWQKFPFLLRFIRHNRSFWTSKLKRPSSR